MALLLELEWPKLGKVGNYSDLQVQVLCVVTTKVISETIMVSGNIHNFPSRAGLYIEAGKWQHIKIVETLYPHGGKIIIQEIIIDNLQFRLW